MIRDKTGIRVKIISLTVAYKKISQCGILFGLFFFSV
jgi:hypothetical protein